MRAMRAISTSLGRRGVEAEIRRFDATSTAIYRRLCGNQDVAVELFGLSQYERRLADHLTLMGNPGLAKEFLQERLSLFENLLVSRPDSYSIRLARALTMTALGKSDRTFDRERPRARQREPARRIRGTRC